MKTIGMHPEVILSEAHLRQNDIFQPLSRHSIWEAFKSGMNVFYRYVDRSEADSYQIARSNLLLLHRTLLSSPVYRRMIKGNTGDKSNNRSTSTLIDSPDLSAHLFTLKKNMNPHILEDSNYHDMLLVITGKITIHMLNDLTNNEVPQGSYLWPNEKKDTVTQKTKKEGDVFFFNGQESRSNCLISIEKDTVVLHIQLKKQTGEHQEYN